LADAVHYARAKGLPLGRCLKILHYLTDRDLSRALEAQQLIENGLESQVAAEVLSIAAKRGLPVHQALQQYAQSGVELKLKRTAESEQLAHLLANAESHKRNISPFELMQAGDRAFAHDRLSEAERCYQKAKELLCAVRGKDDEQVAGALVKLANL